MNIKDNMEAPDNEHENRVRKKRLFRSKIAFSKIDILFIVLVVVGFAGGVFFSILFEYLCALRAIFFGVGIACLVYQFMGGLSPDAKIKVYGLTVTGTLASLFVAILFVYYLFPGNDLKIQPSADNLIAFNSNNAVPVNVNIDDQSTNQHLTIKNTSPDFTSFYIDKCFYGASKACKTNPKKATFVTQKELPKGYGIMCDKKLSSQLVAMQVQIDSNPNMSTPIPITVYGSANCGNEDSQTVFKISWQDANRKDATRIETEGYYRPQIFPSLPPKEVYEKIVSLV